MSIQSAENDLGLKAQLVQAGAPPHVADHALALRPSRRLYVLQTWLLVAIMAGGVVWGGLQWGTAEAIVENNALEHGRKIGAIFYDFNFGMSFIIALFAWIFASGYILIRIQPVSDRLLASTFTYMMLDTKNSPYLRMKRNAARLAGESDPREYMQKMVLGWGSILFWPALTLTVFALLVFEREVHTYTLITKTGSIASPLLPWEDDKSMLWTQAETVELGCNHITGRGASDDIIYLIKFIDGNAIRLGKAVPVAGTWLDRIEIIDAALEASEARFQRWEWLSRDPLHPECLEAQAKLFDREELGRLYKLLRVGKFAGDKN